MKRGNPPAPPDQPSSAVTGGPEGGSNEGRRLHVGKETIITLSGTSVLVTADHFLTQFGIFSRQDLAVPTWVVYTLWAVDVLVIVLPLVERLRGCFFKLPADIIKETRSISRERKITNRVLIEEDTKRIQAETDRLRAEIEYTRVENDAKRARLEQLKLESGFSELPELAIEIRNALDPDSGIHELENEG